MGGYGTWHLLQANAAYQELLLETDEEETVRLYNREVVPRRTAAIVSYSVGGALLLASIPCWATIGKGRVVVHPGGVPWVGRW